MTSNFAMYAIFLNCLQFVEYNCVNQFQYDKCNISLVQLNSNIFLLISDGLIYGYVVGSSMDICCIKIKQEINSQIEFRRHQMGDHIFLQFMQLWYF